MSNNCSSIFHLKIQLRKKLKYTSNSWETWRAITILLMDKQVAIYIYSVKSVTIFACYQANPVEIEVPVNQAQYK